MEANRELADRVMNQLRRIPGIADLRIQQAFDQPKLHVITDRIKAAQSGYTQADVASSLLISLSGSFQTQPTFWLNPQNGVSYSVVTQTPQYDGIPQGLTQHTADAEARGTPEILNDMTTISRGNGMATVNHYDIQRGGGHLRRSGRTGPGERWGRGGPYRGRQPQVPGTRL